jgi:hypothetical protein
MDSTEITVFKNYSGMDEPVLSSIGKLSMRNILVLLVFGGISFFLYKTLIPFGTSLQDKPIPFMIVMIPILIGFILHL